MADGRLIVFILYGIAFAVSSFTLLSSRIMPIEYAMAYLVFGLCGVLISFWVYEDGKIIEELGLNEKLINQKLMEKADQPYKAKQILEHMNVISKEPLDSDSLKMANDLILRYRSKGFLNPEIRLESLLAEKMSLGKTRKQALIELLHQD